MNITIIKEHIDSMGEFVPQTDKDALASALFLLSEANIPETVEARILDTSRASSVAGYLENKWRAIERRAKSALSSARAEVAKATRADGIKRTENAIDEIVVTNPAVKHHDAIHIAAMEVADIFQSIRYALKNTIEGLLELSRSERLDRKMS